MCDWRRAGSEQLPQARAWQVAREAESAKTDVSGNPENYGHPQPDQGNGQGYRGVLRHARLPTTVDVYICSRSLERQRPIVTRLA